MRPILFFLSFIGLGFSLMSQDFDQIPSLGGQLDDWYSSLGNTPPEPFMQGVYYYNGTEGAISPGQTPFYNNNWDRQGALTYEGRQYSNLIINYNTVKDVLLIWSWEMSKEGIQSLLIDQSKIDSFSIHNEKFVSYKYARVNSNDSEGFYRKVMQGNNVICYAKEIKTGELEDLVYEFSESRGYFVQYKGETFNYNRRSSLYRIFPSYKKQIKQFIRENFSTWRSDEQLLKYSLHYFDSIVK